MPKSVDIFQVFISSPSDVGEERQAVLDAIDQINSVRGASGGFRIEPLMWESNVRPETGQEPQASINQQIGDSYDIFLGIMCARFGTKTVGYESGTEEEFALACKRKNENPHDIEIMFYFKDPRNSSETIDAEQFMKVADFKKSLQKNSLYREFASASELQTLVLKHLSACVDSLRDSTSGSPDATEAETPLLPVGEASNETNEPADLGLFELTDQVLRSFERVEDDASSFASAMETLGNRINDLNSDLEESKSIDGTLDREKSSRLMDRMARSLMDFSKSAAPITPKLRSAFGDALAAMQQSILIMSEDNFDDAEGAAELARTMVEMKETLVTTSSQVADFRDVLANFPRLKSSINRSKRIVISEADDLLDFFQGSIKQVDELLDAIREYMEKMTTRSES